MSRQSNFVKVAKYLSTIDYTLFRKIENFIINNKKNKEEPCAIFILGLPRSGTTLTYQCFITAFNVVYLSNFSHFFHQLPFFGNKMGSFFSKNYRSNFKSDKGYVKGLFGPAEGLLFWKRWMGLDIDQSNNYKVNPNIKTYIKNVLSNISTYKKPFVTCYLGHVLAVDDLRRDFPNSLFIVLRRDKVANALSLLRCRQEQDDPKFWFSVKPDECQKSCGLNEYQQIVRQINILNKNLDALENADNAFLVDYEKICINPTSVMAEFKAFASNKGYDMAYKYQLPEKFTNKFNPIEDDAKFFRDYFKTH